MNKLLIPTLVSALLFFSINAYGQTILSLNGTGNYYEIQDNSSNPSFRVTGSTGLVGIGTSSPSEQLEVVGSLLNTNTHTSTAVGTLINTNSSGPTNGEYAGAEFVNAAGTATGYSGAGDLIASVGGIIAYSDASVFNVAAALEENVVMQYDVNGSDPKEVSVNVNGVKTRGDVYPEQDNTDNLGLSGNRWVEVFAANGTINTSDRREKENIRDLHYGLNEIMQLHPVSFTWKGNEERGIKLGLIAQETNEVLDEVVKEGQTPEDLWGIYYSDIIPVLISGMQEQQAIIDAKDAEINALKGQLNQQDQRLARLEAMLLDNSGSATVKPTGVQATANVLGSLEQNTPNPFANVTTIQYTLEGEAQQAMITLMDINGKVVMEQNVEATGQGQTELNLQDFTSGIYFYSLVVDGHIIATKPMVKM